MRPVLLLLAVMMIAAAIIYSDHARRMADALPAVAGTADAGPLIPEPGVTGAPAGPPRQRDPRLARIASCDATAMGLAEDIRPGWWDVYNDHHTEEGLPDSVLLARAEAGNVHAMAVAGMAFLLWSDEAGNTGYEAEGMAWIRRAAEGGDPTAQNELGYAHSTGRLGQALDREESRIWLEKAIRGGDALAGFTLATLYDDGRLAPRAGETASAAELALAADMLAAQRCYADSIDRIADRMLRGRLLPRDLATAGYLRRKTHDFREARASRS
jgi:TPR repeat protein